jgi:twitching motility protein PilT
MADDTGLVPPTVALYPELVALHHQTNLFHVQNPTDSDFSIEFQTRRYRVSVIKPGIFALRKASLKVPSMAECRLHPRIIEYLLSLKNGTVFFFGGFSTGKTTACSAYLVEKVRRDGGLGISLEDPAELPIEGDHGSGRIYQQSISRKDIEARVQEMMRASFDFSLVSELRTPLMCQVFLMAGLAGRIWMTTGHGDSIIEGLIRVVSLASAVNSGGELGAMAIRSQLAETFQAAILMKEIDGRYVPCEYLLREPSTVSMIRANDFAALRNNIETTKRRLQSFNAGPLVEAQ